LEDALSAVNEKYLHWLENDDNWLPGKNNIFRAFSLPLDKTKYILFGESPYPREQSANGYAFWDNAVTDLWSKSGLSTSVNRATSLRNLLKMLLLAVGAIHENDLSQDSIATLDKSGFISTCDELFNALIRHGFLLLNASLVLSQKPVSFDANAWQPFIGRLLQSLKQTKADITLVLFGKVAQRILSLDAAQSFQCLQAEHPYNISFITNESVIKFFKPFHLLEKPKGITSAKECYA
jgi:uracil-DNA glycosylase